LLRTENYELKKMGNFLSHFVGLERAQIKFEKIFDYLLWKLEAFPKSFFYKCSYDFLFLSYSQVKLNRDSDFDRS